MMTKKQIKETVANELAIFNKFHEAYDVTFEVKYVLDPYDEAEGGCGFYMEISTYRDGEEYETTTYDVADAKAKTFYATKEVAEYLSKFTETTWKKEAYH